MRSGAANCLLAAVLFGASTPAASVIARDMDALVLAALLYLGAALATLPFWIVARPTPGAVRRDWRRICGAVVVGGALGPALLTAGLQRTPAATASLLLNMELVATVVLAATLFREHLGRNMRLAAVVLTVAGALLVWEPGSANVNAGSLLVVGACVCWGVDNSLTARIDQITPQHLTFIKGLVAGSANLALGLAVSGAASVHPRTAISALLVGALGYGASITLWVRGAHQLGAARGQVLFASAPFIGAIIGWIAVDQTIDQWQVVAIVLAAIGVAVSLRSAHEHSHEHEPMTHTHEHEHDDHHQHLHEGAHVGRHTHEHSHDRLAHAHPHVPDLHHHHAHR